MRQFYLRFLLIFSILTSVALVSCTVNKEVIEEVIKNTPAKPEMKVVSREGGEVFFDDFSTYGVGQQAPFGEWKIRSNGSYHIEEGVQPNGNIGKVLKTDNNGVLYIAADWKDYLLEVNTKDGEPGVYFRVSDDGSKGYYVTKELGHMTGLRLYKFAGSQKKKIAESQGMDTKDWYYVRIELRGAEIKAFINGKKLIDIIDNDASLSSGGIGVGSCYGGVYFDNVRVAPIR